MSERHYLDLLSQVLESGARKSDRTGTGTKSIRQCSARNLFFVIIWCNVNIY